MTVLQARAAGARTSRNKPIFRCLLSYYTNCVSSIVCIQWYRTSAWCSRLKLFSLPLPLFLFCSLCSVLAGFSYQRPIHSHSCSYCTRFDVFCYLLCVMNTSSPKKYFTFILFYDTHTHMHVTCTCVHCSLSALELISLRNIPFYNVCLSTSYSYHFYLKFPLVFCIRSFASIRWLFLQHG